MKILKKITNGLLILIIGILHTQFALSAGGFGRQFREFLKSCFYQICKGPEDLHKLYEIHAAFWFFYFGILLIPLGLLVHSIEKRNIILPHSFTISYLIVVLIGSYMIPASGMTYFMIPQAIYMLGSNFLKARKIKRSIHSN